MDGVALLVLVHAGAAEMGEHHLAEIDFKHVGRRRGTGGDRAGGCEFSAERILAGGDDTMRRQAFDREGAGHTHLALVLIGAVVEQFDIGGAGDRGVDLFLPGNAAFPPVGMQPARLLGR